MKHLLDSDVIINHIRGIKEIDQKIISENIAISVISYGELLYGANKSKYREKNLNQIQTFLNKLNIQLLNINKEIIQTFAELKALLELKGQKLDNFDILIGATALIHSLTLITTNIKHFQRIPDLKLA